MIFKDGVKEMNTIHELEHSSSIFTTRYTSWIRNSVTNPCIPQKGLHSALSMDVQAACVAPAAL